MAIVKCNECGGNISDQATRCPHCGALSVVAIGVKDPGGVRSIGVVLLAIGIGCITLSFYYISFLTIWDYDTATDTDKLIVWGMVIAVIGLFLIFHKWKKSGEPIESQSDDNSDEE